MGFSLLSASEFLKEKRRCAKNETTCYAGGAAMAYSKKSPVETATQKQFRRRVTASQAMFIMRTLLTQQTEQRQQPVTTATKQTPEPQRVQC